MENPYPTYRTMKYISWRIQRIIIKRKKGDQLIIILVRYSSYRGGPGIVIIGTNMTTNNPEIFLVNDAINSNNSDDNYSSESSNSSDSNLGLFSDNRLRAQNKKQDEC